MTDTTFKFRRVSGVAVLSALLLSGCSSVPDAINPVEWYKSTVDLFDGDDGEKKETAENKGLSGDAEGREAAEAKAAAQGFPKVSDVPETTRASSPEAQAAAREGLIADREQRRYASAPIPRQTEDGTGAPPAPVMAATQPPPPAAPAVPVTPAPVAAATPAPATTAPTMTATAPPPATVADTYRNKLAEKFKPMATAKPDMTAMPERPRMTAANATLARVGDPLATVVISSDGVVSQGSQADGGQPVYVTATDSSGTRSTAGMASPADVGYGAAGGTLKVATILFPNGAATLSRREMTILHQVSAILKEKGGRLRIVGHASSRTRDMDLVRHKMVNFQVSADRADAVAKALVRIGVAPELISVVARSDADPLYYEVMPSGEAANRRAEIYLDS